ncbi:MAG: hypothetical protein IT430_00200 [Phycisphaerales bacterium]|nr:hypothetical protein [Phycisphaerales bacterium]
MKPENRWWVILFAIGAVLLIARWFVMPDGFGRAYVKAVPQAVDAENPDGRWVIYEQAPMADYLDAERTNADQSVYGPSVSRTLGTWIAALLTLFVLSFVIRDNPLYKVAESIFIGVSAAYWMVTGFWDTIVPNLLGKLAPGLLRDWAVPGLGDDQHPELAYLVPLILGIMLLWRLSPVGGWISRWPMAFIIGTFCGLRLMSFLHADFLTQIRNTIVSLYVVDNGSFDAWQSLKNLILVVGVLCCLVYFFFSLEHKGLVGNTARVGIWFLMITFGAAFGYTVMGRIALLAIRIEFLMDDWLWLIDPTNKRLLAEAAGFFLPLFGMG